MEMAGALAGFGLAIVLLVPLALKWQLPFPVVAPWILVIGPASGAAWAAVLGLEWLSLLWVIVEVATILTLSALGAAAAFFSDPERKPPADPRAILSPADGRILYVRHYSAGEAPPIEKHGKPLSLQELSSVEVEATGHLIGIGMHLLNVHVNRAPVGGRVASLVHIPGRFISLRRAGATTTNERLTTVIDGGQHRVVVVQIASRLVRRIVSYLVVNQRIAAGERIGMIKFGSQVDVILPGSAVSAVRVKPGDVVRAGVSILAHVEPGIRRRDEPSDAG